MLAVRLLLEKTGLVWLFLQIGGLFCGVFVARALLFGVCALAPDFINSRSICTRSIKAVKALQQNDHDMDIYLNYIHQTIGFLNCGNLI